MRKVFIFLIIFFSSFLFAENGFIETQEDLVEILNSQEEYYFYDVRTPAEYNSGHIPGAENISHQLLPGALPEEIDKDDLIIVYCRSGNRSGQALRAMEQAGYNNVWDFGSIYKWKGELTLSRE
jgi:phage shock protein E